MRVVDLGFPIRPHFRWRVATDLWSSDATGDLFQSTVLTISCHAFTHVDAPVHFLPGGRHIAGLPVDQWVGETAVVDLTHIAADGQATAAHAGLGAASLRVGQGEAAAEHLLRAVQLEPRNPAHYRTLARLYEGQGRLDLAIVALRDGVSAAALSSPKLQAEVVEELAALYDRAGMGREAALERLRVQSLRSP